MEKENIRNRIIQLIKHNAVRYEFLGFWMNTIVDDNTSCHKWMHFPSEQVAESEMMAALEQIDESEYLPKKILKKKSFKDGDKMMLPEGECTFHAEICYDSDGPYVDAYVEYIDFEDGNDIFNRLCNTVVDKSRENYIKKLEEIESN